MKNYGSITNNKTVKSYDNTIFENYNLITNSTSSMIETNYNFINKKLNATNTDSIDLADKLDLTIKDDNLSNRIAENGFIWAKENLEYIHYNLKKNLMIFKI